MSIDRVASQIEAILKQHCPSAEVAIISNRDIGHEESCYYLAVSGGNAIEIDKIQAIMTMTSAQFIDWKKDDTGEFMIYRVPVRS